MEQVQKLLAWLNLYDGKIDGIYGEKTVEAVKKLQKQVRTARNGKFGTKCLPWCKKFRK